MARSFYGRSAFGAASGASQILLGTWSSLWFSLALRSYSDLFFQYTYRDFTPSLSIDPRLPSPANVLPSARVAESASSGCLIYDVVLIGIIDKTFYYRKSDGDNFAKEFENASDKGYCLDRRFKTVAKLQGVRIFFALIHHDHARYWLLFQNIKLCETWAKRVAEREKTLERRKKSYAHFILEINYKKS